MTQVRDEWLPKTEPGLSVDSHDSLIQIKLNPIMIFSTYTLVSMLWLHIPQRLTHNFTQLQCMINPNKRSTIELRHLHKDRIIADVK